MQCFGKFNPEMKLSHALDNVHDHDTENVHDNDADILYA